MSGFKAYTDVLSHCLIEQGMNDLIEKIPPLHIYLEFGTANLTTLALIGTGLSRSTALELERTGLFSGVQNEHEVLERLKKLTVAIYLHCVKKNYQDCFRSHLSTYL